MKHKLGLIFLMGLMALGSNLSRADDRDAQQKGEDVQRWVSGVGLLTPTAIGPMSALVVSAQSESKARGLKSQIRNNQELAKGQSSELERELSLRNKKLAEELKLNRTRAGRKVMGILGGSYVLGSVLAGPIAEWAGNRVTERLEKVRAESQPNFSGSAASQSTANVSAR